MQYLCFCTCTHGAWLDDFTTKELSLCSWQSKQDRQEHSRPHNVDLAGIKHATVRRSGRVAALSRMKEHQSHPQTFAVVVTYIAKEDNDGSSDKKAKVTSGHSKKDEPKFIFTCNYQGCANVYAHLTSLNRHVRDRKHGSKRKMDEFIEAKANAS
ncbi:hypothetical protein RUND412_010683 [Rhizina undulata]